MTKKDSEGPSSEKQTSAAALIISAIGRNRWLTALAIGALVVALVVIISLIVNGFSQGRSVSFWPPAIGELPTVQAPTGTPNSPTIQPSLTPKANIEAAKTPLEALTGELTSFDSRDKGLHGAGRLGVVRNQGMDLDYRLEYEMPQEGDGYAGIFFSFSPTHDFTKFKALELLISFSPDAICELYVQDQDSKRSYIRLTDHGAESSVKGVTFSAESDKRRYLIPISGDFLDNSMARQSIAGIGFSANTIFTRGQHSCTVHEVNLWHQINEAAHHSTSPDL